MKLLFFSIILTISPILAQCDCNDDEILDVLDIVVAVDCILQYPYPDGFECYCYGCNIDGVEGILGIVSMVDCIINDCWDGETVTDIDGNIYETVFIGQQEWISENLKVTHYNNGDEILTGLTGLEWESLDNSETGAFSVYDDNPENIDVYGNLYNWYAVDDDRSICPVGFHVPSDEDWMELEMALGMSYEEANEWLFRGTNEGSQLAGTADLWQDGDLESNGEFGSSGFFALPGGFRYYIVNSPYYYLGSNGYFGSSTSAGPTFAWNRGLDYNYSEIHRYILDKRFGFSVRGVGN